MTLSLTAPPGESWRLVDALRSLMVPTRPQRGCTACQVVHCTESSDPSSIRYTEEWSTEDELREQVRSERFLRLLAVLEEALEAPQVQFDLPDGSRGLDYVAEVRRDLERGRSRVSPPRSSTED